MRRPRPGLALKFAIALFVIISGALGIVYLAVVPRLESRLVDAKIHELERASVPVGNAFLQVGDRRTVEDRSDKYQKLAALYSSSLDARVAVLEPLGPGGSLIRLADSNGVTSNDLLSDAVANQALEQRSLASGRVTRGGRELAEVAVPLNGDTVVLISAPLTDALANVSLVRRTLILAGIAALGISLLAGTLAAWRFSQRIRGLEDAAERIASGDFEHPVVDPVEDEIGDLAKAFDSMRLRLAQLEHARREFIANASHELRTPLFSLSGFLELIANEELAEGERRDFVEEMSAQVERLTKLATDLLDLSRLDAGQLAVSHGPVDLAATVRTVGEEFRAVAESADHALLVEADKAVCALADEQRVLQIARILVENGIRHTPPRTNVVIGAEQRSGRACLSVRDDGLGVPAGDQEHLFERFYRADGGKASGSGLGLAIAHELALRMGGTVELHSEPGQTIFTLLLPFADASVRADFTGKEPVGAPG